MCVFSMSLSVFRPNKRNFCEVKKKKKGFSLRTVTQKLPGTDSMNHECISETPEEKDEKRGARGVMGRRKRQEIPFSFSPFPSLISPISAPYKKKPLRRREESGSLAHFLSYEFQKAITQRIIKIRISLNLIGP